MNKRARKILKNFTFIVQAFCFVSFSSFLFSGCNNTPSSSQPKQKFYIYTGINMLETEMNSDSIVVTILPEDRIDYSTLMTVNDSLGNESLVFNSTSSRIGLWRYGPIHKDSSFTVHISNEEDFYSDTIAFPLSIDELQCNSKAIPNGTTTFSDVKDTATYTFTWTESSSGTSYAFEFIEPGHYHTSDPVFLDSPSFKVSRDSLWNKLSTDSVYLYVAKAERDRVKSKNGKFVVEKVIIGPKYKAAIRRAQ